MAGTAAHLEIMRFMSPASLTASAAGYSIKGDVMGHETATIGEGCGLGPPRDWNLSTSFRPVTSRLSPSLAPSSLT